MKPLFAGLAGVLVGALLFFGYRLAFTAPLEAPHFHANVLLVVNGQPLDLSGPKYMEDVSNCYAHGMMSPKSRVHLHNGEGDVVHVHHEAATWGHLLANIGMTAGRSHLALDDGRILVDGQGGTIKYIRNGRAEPSLYNEAVRSGDRLVISFGTETEAQVLAEQFPRVAANAEEYNSRPDPATCSGNHVPTFADRLKHVISG